MCRQSHLVELPIIPLIYFFVFETENKSMTGSRVFLSKYAAVIESFLNDRLFFAHPRKVYGSAGFATMRKIA